MTGAVKLLLLVLQLQLGYIRSQIVIADDDGTNEWDNYIANYAENGLQFYFECEQYEIVIDNKSVPCEKYIEILQKKSNIRKRDVNGETEGSGDGLEPSEDVSNDPEISEREKLGENSTQENEKLDTKTQAQEQTSAAIIVGPSTETTATDEQEEKAEIDKIPTQKTVTEQTGIEETSESNAEQSTPPVVEQTGIEETSASKAEQSTPPVTEQTGTDQTSESKAEQSTPPVIEQTGIEETSASKAEQSTPPVTEQTGTEQTSESKTEPAPQSTPPTRNVTTSTKAPKRPEQPKKGRRLPPAQKTPEKEHLDEKQSGNAVMDVNEKDKAPLVEGKETEKVLGSLRTNAENSALPNMGESSADIKKSATKDSTILFSLLGSVIVVFAAGFAYSYVKRKKDSRQQNRIEENVNVIRKSLQNLTQNGKDDVEAGTEMKPLIKTNGQEAAVRTEEEK